MAGYPFTIACAAENPCPGLRVFDLEPALEATMRFPSMLIWGAAALLFAGGVARADQAATQPNAPGNNGATVGVGMICNTADQAKQFLNLRAKGADARQAMTAVNQQAHEPRACGVAAVAYIRDQTLATQAVNDKLLQIVRINVIAGYNQSGWHRIAGAVQYAVVEQTGYVI
jgi:hypothetical protein